MELRNKDYYSLIYKFFANYSVEDVLDVGCASGDFVFQGLQSIAWTGMDVNADLIEIARNTRSRENILYILGDILDEDTFSNVSSDVKYDAVTLLGTLSTIEDGVMAIRCCLSKARKLFVFQGALNPYGFDVLIGHKISGVEQRDYMFSHNTLSVHTLRSVLSEVGFEIVYEEEYVPETRLQCDPNSDVVKSFEIVVDNKRTLSNHLNMISKEFVVIARNNSNTL